jgi:hypothetical protein
MADSEEVNGNTEYMYLTVGMICRKKKSSKSDWTLFSLPKSKCKYNV